MAEWEIIRREDDLAVIVHGDLDIAVEEPLVADVEQHLTDMPQRVSFDLSDVPFMDSAGVRMLLRLWRRHGERVTVDAASPNVERVLTISGVDSILSRDPDPETDDT